MIVNAFEQNLKVLIELHRLFCRGMADTEEYNRICEEFDEKLWYGLSEMERDLVGRFSVALYGLADYRNK